MRSKAAGHSQLRRRTAFHHPGATPRRTGAIRKSPVREECRKKNPLPSANDRRAWGRQCERSASLDAQIPRSQQNNRRPASRRQRCRSSGFRYSQPANEEELLPDSVAFPIGWSLGKLTWTAELRNLTTPHASSRELPPRQSEQMLRSLSRRKAALASGWLEKQSEP